MWLYPRITWELGKKADTNESLGSGQNGGEYPYPGTMH